MGCVPTVRGVELLPEVTFGKSGAHKSMVLARTAGGLAPKFTFLEAKTGTQLIGRIADDVNRILPREVDYNVNCFNKMPN